MHTDFTINLTTLGRGIRVIASLTLITITISGHGDLGLFALIPLAAIYPGITGLLGYDPLVSRANKPIPRRDGEIAVGVSAAPAR